MNRRPRRISYANVTSTLALVLAVGSGGALAASQITGKDIRNGSLTGKDVKRKSLKAADIRSAPLPKVAVREGPVEAPSCDADCARTHYVEAAPAKCKPGERLVGGGGRLIPVDGLPGTLSESVPGADGWTAGAAIWSEEAGPVSLPQVQAYAVCLR